ncbi:MAG: hypothetical protein DIU78_001350 [Pseudomonadota bacterium]
MTRSRSIWLQVLFGLRGVKRWRNDTSSKPFLIPSIHPRHNAISSACSAVTVGFPVPFL